MRQPTMMLTLAAVLLHDLSGSLAQARQVAIRSRQMPLAIGLIVLGSLAALLPPIPVEAQNIDCWYRSKTREATMWPFAACGQPSQAAGVSLVPEVFEDLYFDDDGLACVSFSAEDSYLIHRDGRSAHVPILDNSCMWFEEGLAIAKLEGGRLAYIDKNLNVALDPGYDVIGHFEDGFARVCNGPFSYEQIGEHIRTTGGRCGLIDRSGKLVMDLVHPAEEFAAFTDFKNAHNGCPIPPIEDENSALCHALSHAFRDGRAWTDYTIELTEDRWEVVYSYLERGEERTYTMQLGRQRADVQRHERRGLRRQSE